MWRHKSALLLMCAVVCVTAETDPISRNSLGLYSAVTNCAIASDPNNFQLPPPKACVTYKVPEDFILNIGTLRLSAHMKVLAGSIPYFEDSSTTVQSKTQALLEQNLDPHAVEALFRFAYTLTVTINTTNAQPLLRAATFLQMQNIILICSDVIINRMDTQNVIEFLNHDSHNVSPIRDATENYVQQHFDDVSSSKEFLELHSAAFLRLMRSNWIRNTSEERIFEAAWNWIDHNRSGRVALSYQVMENVRFPLMDNYYFWQNVPKQITNLRNDKVNELLYELVDFKSALNSRPDLQGCRTWPRNGTDRFVKLTWDTSNYPIQMYTPTVRQIEYVANSTNKHLYTVLLHNCLLFAIGGNDSRSVDVYNPATNSWSSIAPMLEIRSEAAAAVRKGIIYVSGGFQRVVGGLTSTEAYSRHMNSWTRLAPMARQRWGHRLIAIGDLLYAIGGYNFGSLSSVEIYDKTLNKWTMGKPMLNPRKHFGAAMLRGKLYVCGGEGAVGHLAEVFDPVKQTWTALANTNPARLINSLVTYKYKLYAFDHLSSSNKSDVYDPETESWTDEPDIFSAKGKRGEIVVLNF